MWPLMKSELVRFQKPALAFGVAHLLILLGVAKATDFFELSAMKLILGLVAYTLPGLIFGLYQFGSYRRINRWTYLIHRPLSPGTIFGAVAGSGATLLGSVTLLPLLLVTAGLDLLSDQLVDARQYVLAPFVLGTILSLYATGAFIALNRSRASFLVLALPSFFLTREAVGLWVFVPLLVVLLWLSYLAYATFKPDLSTHLRRPLAVVLFALPVQYALLGGIVLGFILIHSSTIILHEGGLRGFADFGWNDYYPEGSYEHASFRQPREAVLDGLASLESAEGRQLLRQVELAEVHEVAPVLTSFPTRGQPVFLDAQTVLSDSEKGLFWSFSHDRMLFRGREARSGKAVGWLGASGAATTGLTAAELTAFERVPLIHQDRYLITPRRLYEFDPKRGRVELRLAVPEGERFAAPLALHGGFATVLTDRALYFFEPRDLEKDPGRVDPVAEVALPGVLANLERVHVAELVDSFLVSFLFGSQSERGYGEARQEIVELGLDGRARTLTQRQLGHGFGPLYRYAGFVTSPLLRTLHDLLRSAIGPHRTPRVGLGDVLSRRLPPTVVWWALGLAVLSALTTAWSARRRELDRWERLSWTAAALAVGVPVVISLFAMTEPRRPLPTASAQQTGAERARSEAA